MTGPARSATASSCPSCGAGMEVDQQAGVLRCPYCRREIPMTASQPAGAAWPFGAGVPRITISTRTVATSPTVVRRQVLLALAFVLVAFTASGAVVIPVFSSLFGASGSDSPAEAQEVAVGATARVLSFEATVHGADCGKQSVTKPDDPATSYDDTATEQAKGKFCVVSFSVKNVGEKTDRYPTGSLEATNPTERVLDRDGIAEEYVNNDSDLLSEPIDPGKTVDQFLVFDVPADTTLAYLRISDDLFAEADIKVRFSS